MLDRDKKSLLRERLPSNSRSRGSRYSPLTPSSWRKGTSSLEQEPELSFAILFLSSQDRAAATSAQMATDPGADPFRVAPHYCRNTSLAHGSAGSALSALVSPPLTNSRFKSGPGW